MLEQVICKTNVVGADNLVECGLNAVQGTPKVIAVKGSKEVGMVTSRDRGKLVTLPT